MRTRSKMSMGSRIAARGTAALMTLLVIGGGGAAAQPCGPGDAVKLTSPDAGFDDRMGQVMAISADGSTIAAGAHWDRIGSAQKAGSVSVFRRSGPGWSAVKLTAGDVQDGAEFGGSVAVSADGSTLAVGASLYDNGALTDAGAVYIFTRSGETWTQQARLTPGTTGFHTLDSFGADVAISADGGVLAIGAPRWDHDSRSDEGAVYVYTRAGTAWSQATLLRLGSPASGDKLGGSVSMSADAGVIAAGAGEDDTDVSPGLLNAGSVMVYRRTGPSSWATEAKLFAPDAEAQDYFGFDVAVSGGGGAIAVGMPFDSTPTGAGAGSVRVYTYTGTWVHAMLPIPSAAGPGLLYGYSVALSHDGSALAAGSWEDTIAGQIGAGSVYLFDRAGPGWSERTRIVAPQPDITGHFGITVGLASDGTLAVGEYRHDVGGEVDAGAVWVLGASCQADLNCDGVADFADYLEFLNLYDAQDPVVDFNQDGVVDFADYLEFLNLYEMGC